MNHNKILASGGREFVIPEGYQKVYWECLSPGREVYIVGTNDGTPWAYGPHTVVDTEKKILVNSRGSQFYEQTDGLLVKIQDNT